MPLLLLLVFGCAQSATPAPLTLDAGPLAACPSSPNCVSSEADPADLEHSIAPLKPRASQTPAALLAEAEALLAAWPRTTLVARSAGGLRYECRSRLFRFVDDLELRVDEAAGEVDVRSASRVGRGDLGVNRERVEALRAALSTGD